MTQARESRQAVIGRYPMTAVLAGSWAALAIMAGVLRLSLDGPLAILAMPAYLSWLGSVFLAVETSGAIPVPLTVVLVLLLAWLVDRFVMPVLRWRA